MTCKESQSLVVAVLWWLATEFVEDIGTAQVINFTENGAQAYEYSDEIRINNFITRS